MGCCQTEQPASGEKGIRPGEAGGLIASNPATARSTTQQTAKPHAEPAVEIGVHRSPRAVLEIVEPATKRAVHVDDDPLKRTTTCSTRLRPKRVLQFLETLLPRPVFRAEEVVPQKTETLGPRIDDLCFRRMQRQTVVCHPCPNQFLSSLSFFRRVARNHPPRAVCFGEAIAQRSSIIRATPRQDNPASPVVCVTNHIETTMSHQMVQRIEIDVTQQRTENRALRRTGDWNPFLRTVHDARLQKRFDHAPSGCPTDVSPLYRASGCSHVESTADKTCQPSAKRASLQSVRQLPEILRHLSTELVDFHMIYSRSTFL